MSSRRQFAKQFCPTCLLTSLVNLRNVQFRKMVDEKRRVYLSSHFKREKRLIAETIVSNIMAMDPPGRFLSRDSKTGLWFSIGWDRAREKASQALRENSKKIRAEIHQKDIERQRENAKANGISSGTNSVPSAPGNGKPGPYDHQYPFPPPGPGWGYPYYYGYGPQQIPPYPPVPPIFHHPQVYPPPPPMAIPPTAPNGAPGYGHPDVVPFGARQPERYHQGRLCAKETDEDDQLRRTESDEHMDSGSSDGTHLSTEQEDRAEEHDIDFRPNLKCGRIKPLLEHHDEQASHIAANEVQHESYPQKPSYNHLPPPTMTNLNHVLLHHTPSKPHHPSSHKSPGNRPSPIFTANTCNGTTPNVTANKLAHASPPSTYTIQSPHFGAFHPGATLTPGGTNGLSALDEILASPETEEGSSMGYTRSISMDSPLANSPCRDRGVPFSPIHAQMDINRHPQLKPRPFYR